MGLTPDVIVLDLDGTLMDHEGAVIRALDAWVRELLTTSPDAPPQHAAGPTAAEAEFVARVRAAWFAAEERHFTAWRDGLVTFDEQRRRRLRDVLPVLGLPVGTDDELDETFVGYLTHYERSWVLFDDALPTLDALERHGLRVALLTNGVDEQQHAKLRRIGLAGRFEQVFTAESLGVAKPRPGAYAAVCRALGVEPGQVLHVGDHPDLDVRAPASAGMIALHLDRAGDSPFDDAHRIRTLPEILARLDTD